MPVTVVSTIRECHRLRKLIRNLEQELARIPISIKEFDDQVREAEGTLHTTHDQIRKLQLSIREQEGSLKSTQLLLQKYEKQLNDLTHTKEVIAKQHEIANAQEKIAQLEDGILTAMEEIEHTTPLIPKQEQALKDLGKEFEKFKEETRQQESDLTEQLTQAKNELKKAETLIPEEVTPVYNRLVKSYGPEGLAVAQGKSCGHCQMSMTTDQHGELAAGHFVCCNNCGRALFSV